MDAPNFYYVEAHALYRFNDEWRVRLGLAEYKNDGHFNGHKTGRQFFASAIIKDGNVKEAIERARILAMELIADV